MSLDSGVIHTWYGFLNLVRSVAKDYSSVQDVVLQYSVEEKVQRGMVLTYVTIYSHQGSD